MFLLGYDIGSSSVKAALVRADNRQVLGVVAHPATEMAISAPQPGWAEQDPALWWAHLCSATKQLLEQTGVSPDDIQGIGIGYQMHGLVAVDHEHRPVRPAIIWCDSRAVGVGETAAAGLSESYCLEHLLNLPGNFTAAKLRWVRENEPDVYRRIHKIMLPGDYIALRLTGEAATTVTGLSEGVFWDFKTDTPSQRLLEQLQIDPALLAHVAPNFEVQGRTHAAAAADTGLRTGIPVTYRAGDQPNNALALNVLDPGEVAATGGTSGVVYGVLDRLAADPLNRVNSFAHINHRAAAPRIGVLLCINGSGILYNWLRQQVAAEGATYPDLERLAATVPPGSDGLCVLPFGNGAERMLGNRNPGAQIANLHFNRHQRAHLFRAGLEGIAFSFVYGMKVLSDLGLNLSVIRVGNDNLFQSNIFAHTIAQLTGARIEVLRTTGAVGAAIASGVGVGLWPDVRTGLGALESLYTVEPSAAPESLLSTYERWERLV